MKRTITLLLILALFIIVPRSIFAQNGTSAYPSAQIGALMQNGERGELAWGGDILLPFITIADNYRHLFGAEPSVLVSDFGEGDLTVIKGYLTYERPLMTILNLPIQIGVGSGPWVNVYSDGKDDIAEAAKVYIGARALHVEIMAVAEAVKAEGSDLYFVGLQLKFIN